MHTKTQEIAGYKLGMRVRVNTTITHTPAHGKMGTIIGLPLSWGRGQGCGEWLEVKLDGHERPAKWHHTYFDIAEPGADKRSAD